MALVTRSFTYSAGAVIIASQHNTNETTLYNLVNGNLNTANLATNAGIVDTQLAQISTASKVSATALTGNILGSGNASLTGQVEMIIGNGTDVISTGIQGDIRFPFAATITGVYLFADQDGDIIIDLWKDTFANFPPTVADTITASEKPTLSTSDTDSDTTLTGWTTSITAGDIIRVNVDSVATCTRVSLVLTFTRTA